eukprot:11907282-Alexandrium_andersonii.AAC.1
MQPGTLNIEPACLGVQYEHNKRHPNTPDDAAGDGSGVDLGMYGLAICAAYHCMRPAMVGDE